DLRRIPVVEVGGDANDAWQERAHRARSLLELLARRRAVALKDEREQHADALRLGLRPRRRVGRSRLGPLSLVRERWWWLGLRGDEHLGAGLRAACGRTALDDAAALGGSRLRGGRRCRRDDLLGGKRLDRLRRGFGGLPHHVRR